MRLIHEESIHTELLKRDYVVLVRVAVELVELELDRLSRSFHLLDGEAFCTCLLRFGDAAEHFIQLLL